MADLERPVLADEDRHHLARVLRVRDGSPITIGDGQGSWRAARFGDEIEVTGPMVVVPRPAVAIGVAFALVKGSRIDDVTRHLTELGVDEIEPFTSQRCVVRWDPATSLKRHRRLVRISVEAAMQCRRAWLPRVAPLATFAELVARPGVAVAQMGAPRLGDDVHTVLIGPEGGFDSTEVAAASRTVSLGAHVLRAETAALTAGALLADRRSGSQAVPR